MYELFMLAKTMPQPDILGSSGISVGFSVGRDGRRGAARKGEK
jgi:hypothetical protein